MRFTIILALCFIGAASAGSLNKREAATFVQPKDPYKLIDMLSEDDPESYYLFTRAFEAFYDKYVAENHINVPEVPRRNPDENGFSNPKDPHDLVDSLNDDPEIFFKFKYAFAKFIDEFIGEDKDSSFATVVNEWKSQSDESYDEMGSESRRKREITAAEAEKFANLDTSEVFDMTKDPISFLKVLAKFLLDELKPVRR